MKFVYNLTQKVLINGSKPAPELLHIISDLFSLNNINNSCLYVGSYKTEREMLFYSVKMICNESEEIIAFVNAEHGNHRECALEILESASPAVIEGTMILSTAALRATLKRVYSGVDACITFPKEVSDNPDVCLGAVRQIYKYLDLDTISRLSTCANFESPKTGLQTIVIITDDEKQLPDGHYPSTLAQSANKNTAIDRLVDYLIDSDVNERIQLLELLSKYGKYTEDGQSHKVFSAFVEGDEELIFELVHSYCLDMYSKSQAMMLEQGVKTIINQNLRDRFVLRLIYDGYDTMPFVDLIEKNKGEIAFCAAFRDAHGLFDGDNAESYNIMLASHFTSMASESDSIYELVKTEIKTIDDLLFKAENAIEFSMINSYKKVLLSLGKRAEEVTEIGDNALYKIASLVEMCDENSLYSAETDDAILDVCSEFDSDFNSLKDDIEAIRYKKYSSLVLAKIESTCQTNGSPRQTLQALDLLLKSEDKEQEPVTDDISTVVTSDRLDELSKKFLLISEMNRENYLEIYSKIFGSDYLNELLDYDDSNDQYNNVFLDYYTSKLLNQFALYSDFIEEINECPSISDNSALKILIKEKYSDMLCCALENCGEANFSDIVAGYDYDKVDDRVFFPLLFRRACEIAKDNKSIEFIDKSRDTTQNDVIKTLLLAAKLTSSDEILPQYLYLYLEELVSSFSLIEKYINGDIIFNANVRGNKYCALSLKMYIDARCGTNMERVYSAAQNSIQLNNFLADMDVKGFEHIVLKQEAASPSLSDLQTNIEDVGVNDIKENDQYDTSEGVVIMNDKVNNDGFAEPETLKVIVRNDNAEKMKFGIVALSALTLIAIIILIIIMNK